MMLSENIQALRRQNGLSQEQLAMRLGVSRQAVSKWETGAATPELDKLLALSECFHVSLDMLTGALPAATPAPQQLPAQPQPAPPGADKRIRRRAGIALCLAGGGCLMLGGILSLLRPAAIDRLDASSALTLTGSGALCLLCILCLGAGLLLLLRKK